MFPARLVLLPAALLVLACAGSSRRPGGTPTLAAATLGVEEPGLVGGTVRVDAEVTSPSAARVERATYEVVVDGVVVVRGEQALAVPVEPGQRAPVSVAVPTQWVRAPSELAALAGREGGLLVALRGTLAVRAGSQVHTLPLTAAREVRAPRLPSVTLQELDAARSASDRVDLAVSLGVVNPNPFPVKVAGLRWRLSVDGRPLGEAQAAQNATVPASSSRVYTDEVALTPATFGPTARTRIASGELPYVVEGELAGEGFSVPFRLTGTARMAPSTAGR